MFDQDSALRQLDAQIDMVHASSFFHLFNKDGQIELAKRIITLLKPQKGSLLFGRHVGRAEAAETPSLTYSARNIFRHNEASWTEMWKQIGRETGTEWQAHSELIKYELPADMKEPMERDGTRSHRFTVRRL